MLEFWHMFLHDADFFIKSLGQLVIILVALTFILFVVWIFWGD